MYLIRFHYHPTSKKILTRAIDIELSGRLNEAIILKNNIVSFLSNCLQNTM